MSSTFEENLDKSSFSHPADYVKETARHKTMEVAQKLASQPVSLTMVVGDGREGGYMYLNYSYPPNKS